MALIHANLGAATCLAARPGSKPQQYGVDCKAWHRQGGLTAPCSALHFVNWCAGSDCLL